LLVRHRFLYFLLGRRLCAKKIFLTVPLGLGSIESAFAASIPDSAATICAFAGTTPASARSIRVSCNSSCLRLFSNRGFRRLDRGFRLAKLCFVIFILEFDEQVTLAHGLVVTDPHNANYSGDFAPGSVKSPRMKASLVR
jgi:hypothetical protein